MLQTLAEHCCEGCQIQYVIRNGRGLPEKAGLDVLRGIWILEARIRAGWREVRGVPPEGEEERRVGKEEVGDVL